LIPKEDPTQVEAKLRALIERAASGQPGIAVESQRLLLARAMKPLPGNKPLVDALCSHASALFGEKVEASGTPLYTDARLFAERGIPAVITAPDRAPCSRATPNAPKSTSSSRTCGARRRSSVGRCSTKQLR
jgi:acetylornithine deacetylase/succinyl-diaminopimelate desuccinylase-like protein